MPFNRNELDRAQDLDGTEIAVVAGEIGVAENGAVWIPQTVKYKALYFIAEKLVIILDRNRIVVICMKLMRNEKEKYQFGTFISGPSRLPISNRLWLRVIHGARMCW